MPNAPSESLEKNFSFISCANSAPSESPYKKKLFFHFLCKVCLRTPDPATAFPNRNNCAMAEPLARFEGFEGFDGFKGFEGFEGLHFPCHTLPLNP